MSASETTIVIPTWNSLDVLPRCLTQLAEHSPETAIVIVDNGSSDGTPDWITEHAPQVSLIRNADNVGFGAACNQGVAATSTPWVCLLNADAFVTDGWLDALHATIAQIPGAALAGPLLLNEDGSVQEAGAIITQAADGLLYGYGQDPDLWEFKFPRIVDYCSAACLLVDRAVFVELGGFDVETFGRAYYEDADLCLRAARAGHRTVYAPTAAVVHVRNASGRAAVGKALIARNRYLFAERWRPLLVRRPLQPDAPGFGHRLIAARDADRYERLLVICRDLPNPDDPFGKELTSLQQDWPNARIAVLTDAPSTLAEAKWLLDSGIEVGAGYDDWYGWLRLRLAFFTTVVVIGEDVLQHFGRLIEWTQVDFQACVLPDSNPASVWRNFHGQDDSYLLDEAFDRGAWTISAPGSTLTGALEQCGWTPPLS